MHVQLLPFALLATLHAHFLNVADYYKVTKILPLEVKRQKDINPNNSVVPYYLIFKNEKLRIFTYHARNSGLNPPA